MVANHWSDDGMVTTHRSGLVMTLGKGYDLLKNRELVVVKIVMVKRAI